MNESQIKTRYIPLKDWEKYYDWPKTGGLRYFVLHKNENGFSSVIKKVGKKIIIDETAFFNWIKNHSILPKD